MCFRFIIHLPHYLLCFRNKSDIFEVLFDYFVGKNASNLRESTEFVLLHLWCIHTEKSAKEGDGFSENQLLLLWTKNGHHMCVASRAVVICETGFQVGEAPCHLQFL